MNVLVESIKQLIQALPPEEQNWLKAQLQNSDRPIASQQINYAEREVISALALHRNSVLYARSSSTQT